MNRMLAMLITGAGAGVGARGLMGLRNVLRSKPKVDPVSSVPVSVPISMRSPHTEDEEPMPKFAADKQAILDTFRSTGDPAYWEWPTGIALGAGGLYGGWKLMDWLMDARRKSQMGGDLDKAKKDYQNALREQYSSAMMAKGAGAELDDVADKFNSPEEQEEHLEKLASLADWQRTGSNLAHGGAGMYLTALMALTGGAGLGAYNWTKSHSKAKALERAMKKRRQMRTAPQPIMAVPQYDDEETRGA